MRSRLGHCHGSPRSAWGSVSDTFQELETPFTFDLQPANPMKIDFTGQTVLVTGATRGIGRQLAKDFRKAGARLVVTGTRADEIGRLQETSGNDTRWVQADFLDDTSLESFVDFVSCLDRIDVCVNNAGINRVDWIEEVTDRDWQDVVNVNLKAPTLITRAVAPIMKRNGYGRIVNISSIWGHVSWTKRATYASTKFGLRGLTVASANDLAPDGILVNAVSPGFTLTEMIEKNYSTQERRQIEAKIPLGRMATVEEISTAVLFLASPLNTYITGQSLVVDGGYVSA